MMGYTHSTCPK